MNSNLFNLPCPVCEGAERETFFALAGAPVLCHVRYERADAARQAVRGHIRLARCADCGLIYNHAFEPEKIAYEVAYDNALHFSPHFRAYAEALAGELRRRHALREKTIVEIGCGDGFFLNLLCDAGKNRGWGFDPATHRRGAAPAHLQLIQGYFTHKALPAPPDLICCRHVLEHLPQPRPLLREVRRACRDASTVVFFEVPDGRFTFDRGGLWDILYEHCSYYTPDSLRRLFESEGFRVLRVESAYQGQFLQIEAVLASPDDPPPAHLPPRREYVERLSQFNREFQETVQRWRAILSEFHARRERVVLWGAGTKGVMFLNAVGLEQVACVVDINPGKRGAYVAGAGLRIVAPEDLREEPPDAVIVMNPAYRAEVAACLAELGLAPRLMDV